MTDQPLRVLFIVNSLCFGGAEKHAVTLANALGQRNFDVSLVYLKNDVALLPQVDVQCVSRGVFCANVRCKVDRQAISRIAIHLRRQRVDLIVCINTYALLYGALARKAAHSSCRIADLFHTTEVGSFKERAQMWFYRPFILRTDLLVYVCTTQQRYWRNRLLRARQDVVIHNGIDLARFSVDAVREAGAGFRKRHDLPAAARVVGLCAAMRPEKAHGDLLQAIALLRCEGLNVHALLIGDGVQRLQIMHQVRQLGLQEQVVITGFMDDVRPAVAACDMMAIVSHHVETFSIAALEAMAMGKPMVMSDIGGAAEQVAPGENGYLYPRGDISALAGAIRLLCEPHHARRLGAAARAVTERRFVLSVMVDRYVQAFTTLCSAEAGQARQVNAA